jgi:hypothetical protein
MKNKKSKDIYFTYLITFRTYAIWLHGIEEQGPKMALYHKKSWNKSDAVVECMPFDVCLGFFVFN